MSIDTATLPIELPASLTRPQLLSFPPFSTWLNTLSHSLLLQHTNPSHTFRSDPYSLRSLSIQSVDFFGARIGFLKFRADIANSSDETLAGSVFLRGGSVAILLLLDVEGDGEPWVVLTVQPRVPAGSLEFVELPAGMLDDSATFSGAAAKEIQEECGIEISAARLVDLTELALGAAVGGRDEKLQTAVYPSCGGCDEFLRVFAYRHRIDAGTLDEWRGRLTGLRDHGEKITLKVVRLADLWKETLDVKALSAVALWEGLKREGKV